MQGIFQVHKGTPIRKNSWMYHMNGQVCTKFGTLGPLSIYKMVVTPWNSCPEGDWILWSGVQWFYQPEVIDKKRTISTRFNTNLTLQAVCPFEFGCFKLYVVDLFKLTLIVIACGTALFTQFRSALMNVTLHCGW